MATRPECQLLDFPRDRLHAQFRADVLAGLAREQKAIPARWFYDRKGSELFEEITALPEYYPTRAEIEILGELRRRGSRVLSEHVLSGTGLAYLHAAVCALRGAPPPASTPAQISAAALAGNDPLARETVAVFCGWFGAVLGDLALLYGAQGGVYLAGGVLPRIKPLLLQSTFVERFLDKGAMREALARTPVRLVDHAQLGVIGAASWYFARDADERARTTTQRPDPQRSTDA